MLSTIAEQLTLQFYSWELKCRGWQVFDEPVDMEPPFEPFFSHHLPVPKQIIDDGRRPTLLSSIARSVRNAFNRKLIEKEEPEEDEILAYPFVPDWPQHTVSVVFPKGYKVPLQESEELLLMLGSCANPVSFEIVATGNRITVQYACSTDDARFLKSLVKANFPQAVVMDREDALKELFSNNMTVIDFGLENEFMRPIRVSGSFEPDPLTSIIGLMDNYREGESGAIQVIFKKSGNGWAESIIRSVTNEYGDPFFADAPDMLPLAKQKVISPLYGVVIRVIGSSELTTLHLSEAIRHISRSQGNQLIPLSNNWYDNERHCEDVLLRQSHRLGMLLNSKELATLVHFPSASIISSKIERDAGKTKKAPGITKGQPFVLGTNIHQGEKITVTVSNSQRLKHTHIIGATGTGKSTLLKQMIVQDIEQGNGIAVLDPHGDLIESVLKYIPERRIKDVLLIDPTDTAYPVGLNILTAHSDIEKEILSSDLVAAFRKQSTSWGDQMNSVFANAILAFLESTEGGTLADLRRFLIEKNYRDTVLATVTDPTIVYYWQKEYPLLKSSSIGSILTRLDSFLRPKLIRNMVAQKKSIDFDRLMSEKKIILIKLSQGLMGEENSYLLGTFIVAKLQQAAMARQAQSESLRNDFFVYIDEFQHFITPTMASILSGARKYHLGLILAHQSMQQLGNDSDVAGSVMANAGTRICFRLGDTDARKMEEGFSFFEAKDLQNLGTGEVIMRVDKPENDFSLTTNQLSKSNIPEIVQSQIIEYSRNTYGTPQQEVEAMLNVTMKLPEQEKELDEKPIQYKKKQEVQKEQLPSSFREQKELPETVATTFIQKEEDRQHRLLQNSIKQMAEKRGYKATIEAPLPDAKGFVDVLLEQNGKRIAIEISVTTPATWEMHNIQKCISAGYDLIIATAPESSTLEKIRLAISQTITESSKVLVLPPDALAQYLDENLVSESNTETRIKGYRVKVEYKTLSEEEQEQKQNAIAKVVADSIKKKKK